MNRNVNINILKVREQSPGGIKRQLKSCKKL